MNFVEYALAVLGTIRRTAARIPPVCAPAFLRAAYECRLSIDDAAARITNHYSKV